MEDGVDPHSGEEPQKPEAVVVAPTRELAIQIKEEARKFSSGSTIKPVVAYGGTSVGFQLSTLFKQRWTLAPRVSVDQQCLQCQAARSRPGKTSFL